MSVRFISFYQQIFLFQEFCVASPLISEFDHGFGLGMDHIKSCSLALSHDLYESRRFYLI